MLKTTLLSKQKVISTLPIKVLSALLILVVSWTGCTWEPEALSVEATPSSVPIGGKVTVTGKGFTPGAQVTILANATLMGGRGAVAVVMGKATADSDGAITQEIMIPPPPAPRIPPKFSPATYTIRATDDKVVAKGTFTVLRGSR